ncbi:efflux transporter outer membrane subunit [Ruegeria sp. 2205SS24-7]|uniref:efflux transporter outer membrane subunit n=1 Tax=Ruegeria discodermiae TaxID=3064389 RepID=UPI002741F484|nr:efflux transporter outer membrane subunit [Ruegeria sp. 2205SS24-7]MDP5218846.1 efflux transporter outer membrane subunit [Ruegeria sp. 2205SS24-7]
MKASHAALGLLLAGCTVGPELEMPQATLQQRFVNGDAAQIGAVAERRWWQDYRDPVLNDLVTRGLAQNLDVIAAMERISEAQDNLRSVGVSTDVEYIGLRSGGDEVTTTTTNELEASYVIDLFGGVRRERESAAAELVAAQADVETTRLAWLAELIAAYSNARYYQTAITITRQTISDREQTLEITRRQFEFGDATEYAVAEAEALLAAAKAGVPEFRALFNSNVFAIGTLLNEQSGPIMTRMERGAPQLRTPPAPRTGLPAELLRNRPDVRSSEAALAAAVAEVGVAEADLYPSLTLTGTIERTSGLNAWSFGPDISLPIFNQGLLRATRDSQLSLARQAEIDWRSQVVSAVEDVQVAQSDLTQDRARANALNQAATSYDKALSLAQENYRAGAITLTDLLVTDRDTASARLSAASAVNDAAQAWAKLQIAIGAGAAATQ